MTDKKSRGRLKGGSRRNRGSRNQEEIDPLESLGNMFDVMLVFACGLMLAVILLWNVDLKNVVDIIDDSQLTELEDQEVIDQTSASVSDYDSLGTAVYDPSTGKTFVVSDEDQAGSQNAGSHEASSQQSEDESGN